jgi:hypothetical protein
LADVIGNYVASGFQVEEEPYQEEEASLLVQLDLRLRSLKKGNRPKTV